MTHPPSSICRLSAAAMVVALMVVVATISVARPGCASPPALSQPVTLGVNQQRSGLVPIKGPTSVSSVDSTGIAAITSPVYTSDSNFLLIGHKGSGRFFRPYCTASINGSLVSNPFPTAFQNASAVGVPSVASDDRAYVVAAAGSKYYMLAFSHSCELMYTLSIGSNGVSMSPLVLADNSVVVFGDNILRVIANSSDPFGGVSVWSTIVGTVGNVGLALSADNSTGVVFLAYMAPAGKTNNAYVSAWAPLGGSQVGYSSKWSQQISGAYYCTSPWACSLTPVVCGSLVLATTSGSIVALDQATGAISWQFGGYFPGSGNQPVYHPAGILVVVDNNTGLLALQVNSTTTNPNILWSVSTGAFQLMRPPVFDALGNLYVIGGASSTSDPNGTKLFVFDSRGNVLISRPTNVPSSQATSPSYISQPVVLEDRIMVAVGELVIMY